MTNPPSRLRIRGADSNRGSGPWMPRLLLVLLTAAATVVGPVPTAQAHAFLAASNPSDGQVLATAPTHLRLDFSESVVLGATHIDIVDGAGRHLPPIALRLVSQGDADDTELPVAVVANLPTLGRSSYRVSWQTISSDDLHATKGVLVFGVGQQVTARGLDEASPSPIEAGLRWLILLGLCGALGGALARYLLERAGGPGSGRIALRADRFSMRGAILGAGTAFILLVYQITASGTVEMSLLGGSYGLRWGAREAGLLLLAASAIGRSRLPATVSRLLLLAGAALACVGTATLGHSGAWASTNVTRILASAAHLCAAAIWVGCLSFIAVTMVPIAGTRAPSRALTRTFLRRFGPPAAGCVSVMVVTGVYLSSSVIGSVDAALFTVYGRTLLLKLLLAAVAGFLALVNTLRVHRSPERAAPPGRTVMAEALIALGVLALAAVLSSGQPAMEPQLVQATISPSVVVDGAAADLQETVSISPNRPGASVVLVTVFDTRRPAPAPIRQVQISVQGASARGEYQSAERLSNDRWSVATQLLEPGTVTVNVLVRRGGLPDTVRSFAWTVGGAQGQTRSAVVSTSPIAGSLKMLAAVLLCLMLSGWILVPWLRVRLLRERRAAPEGGGQAAAVQVAKERAADIDRPDEQDAEPIGVGAGSRK